MTDIKTIDGCSPVCMNCMNAKTVLLTGGVYVRNDLMCIFDGSLHHNDYDSCEHFKDYGKRGCFGYDRDGNPYDTAEGGNQSDNY